MLITSKDNAAVKALKKLLSTPKRSDERIVLEGIHVCQAFLAQGGRPFKVWVAESSQMNLEIAELLMTLQTERVAVNRLPDAIFRELSILEQGASIIFEVVRPTETAWLTEGNAILLDGVQDPGNMGSILRSAAAAGVRHVYLNSTCVNPFSPKVLRAAVGAHFSLHIVEHVNLIELMGYLRQHGTQTIATSSYAASNLYDLNLNQAVAWLMGNEGAGVAQALIEAADMRAYIPMRHGESLNVAAAAAVCLFEMQRQQRH
ncbi:TrmH family RNA methyltransferase [Hydromonas duriensis]|uniref:TrmH family RNA methyltransferase n=1 Tax=Hydromonas duriensis TaxID=1527608 RepID=A0A4R6Y8E3_9BURK|nr:RNA methyltransferase [Hydromonas duriensis]TDR31675.1 TrmH family RNA methyltransferase [Hydromonas duriensis]